MGRALHGLLFLGCLAGFATGLLAQLEAGTYTLNPVGDFVALEAEEAPLFDILDGLERLYDFRLSRGALSNRTIRAKFRPLPVDELLARLEVNYVLYFSRAGTGPPEDGYLFTSDLAQAIYSQFPESIRALIRNLYDDDIFMNAVESLWELQRRVAEVLPMLEQTLHAEDFQARQLALFLIQNGTTNHSATGRFLDVALEALADDSFPMLPSSNPHRDVFVSNAQSSYQWFVRHPEAIDAAESRLVQAMYSEDGQYRLLAAALLGGQKKIVHLPRIVQVMKPHLADNNMMNDAKLIRNILEVIGAPAVAYLEAIKMNPVDEQQAHQAEWILERIRTAGEYREKPDPALYMVHWTPDQFPRLDELH